MRTSPVSLFLFLHLLHFFSSDNVFCVERYRFVFEYKTIYKTNHGCRLTILCHHLREMGYFIWCNSNFIRLLYKKL